MDAISFVLGVRASHLRGAQLRDLIYRVHEGTEATEAYVTLIFHSIEDDEEFEFKRRISEGTSAYYINEQKVSWDEYNNTLMEYGILVKARNFLVFQVCNSDSFVVCINYSDHTKGDVESIAQKSPKDLTALFEQISGSDELKKDYETLREAKERAEENTIFNFQRRKGILTEKKVFKEQKEEALRFQKLLEEQVLLLLLSCCELILSISEKNPTRPHAIPALSHQQKDHTK
jgi:structural maintenance of chromosome 1